MGEHWRDNGLVFSTGLGTLVDRPTSAATCTSSPSGAGLGHWHPHELRHSAAGLLSAAGVPLEEVADLLGHATTRVTSAVYRHRTTPTVEAARDPMDRLLGP